MAEYVAEGKKLWKGLKNTVMQTPELEIKVKEATSNEKWGPTSQQMKELAQASFNNYTDLPVIMAAIFRRLNDHGKYWRHVYKALLLLDYLIKNGSEQVIREARDRVIEIQTLSEFQHIDENNKDVGLSGVLVRERSKLICELLHDEDRLKQEREKAKQLAKKGFQGMGSEGGMRGGGSGFDWNDGPSEERMRDRNSTWSNDRDTERESGSSARDRDRDEDDFRPRESPRGLDRDFGARDDRDRERERERQREQQQREQREREQQQQRETERQRAATASAALSNASNVGNAGNAGRRPRAPSVGNGNTPLQANTRAASLLDLDDSAHQTARNAQLASQERDFFGGGGMGVQQSGAPTLASAFATSGGSLANNNSGFGNSGFGSSTGNNGFSFDSTPANNAPSSAWDFGSTSSNQPSQSQSPPPSSPSDNKKEAAPNDPWANKHLFDFDSSNSSSSSQTVSSSINASNKKPMGSMISGAGPTTTTSKTTIGTGMGAPAGMGLTPAGNPGMGMGMTPIGNAGMGMGMGMGPGAMGATGFSSGMAPGMGGMGASVGVGYGMSGMNTMPNTMVMGAGGMSGGMGMSMGMNAGGMGMTAGGMGGYGGGMGMGVGMGGPAYPMAASGMNMGMGARPMGGPTAGGMGGMSGGMGTSNSGFPSNTGMRGTGF